MSRRLGRIPVIVFLAAWMGMFGVESVGALEHPTTVSPPTDRESRVIEEVRRGFEAFEDGRYHDAIASFQMKRADAVHSKDVLDYFLGESLFHAGHFEQAKAILSTFEEHFPDSKWTDFARSRFGDTLFATGQYDEALSVYEGLLRDCPDYPHPGALKMAIFQCYERSGRHQEAADKLYRFTVEFPRNIYRSVADHRLKDLSRIGVKPAAIDVETALDIAVSLRIRRLHKDAIDWINALGEREGLSDKERWMIDYNAARILLTARQFRLSIEKFEKLANRAPSASWRLRTHKWRSRAYEGLGLVEAAVEQQGLYWRSSDFLTPKRRAARGELYLRHGFFGKAADWFKGLTLSRNREGRRLRVLRAIAAFSAGRVSESQGLFTTFKDAGFGQEAPLKYWKARIDAATKNREEAVSGYRELASTTNGYYAEQAKARLRELGEKVDDHWSLLPTPEQETEDLRFKSIFGIEETVPKKKQPLRAVEILRRDYGHIFPDLNMAFELLSWQRKDDAIWHLRRVANEVLAFRGASAWKRNRWSYAHRELLDYRKGQRRGPWGNRRNSTRVSSSRERIKALKSLDLDVIAQRLSVVFESLGDYYFVLRLLNLSHAPKGDDPLTRRQLELRYPKAYQDIVESESRRYGIEPFIMWALMRTESHFNTLAVSPAEARGLMQVIWQTSQRISESGGFVDMGNAQILLPRVSIALGAYYVSSLLNKFSGQLPFAFAAYNAGPHRVSAWLDRKPDMKMDQFIEEIQYEEARAYVKKVLTALITYRKLYQGDSGTWIGQVINRRYRPEPDY